MKRIMLLLVCLQIVVAGFAQMNIQKIVEGCIIPPPTNVKCVALSDSSILVTWDSVIAPPICGIKNFEVFVDDVYYPQTTLSVDTKQTLIGLEANKTYGIKVRTISDFGSSIFSETVAFKISDYSLCPLLILSNTNIDGLSYVEGLYSSTQNHFTVIGSNLKDNIILTPPDGFEISTEPLTDFVPQAQIVLAPTLGIVASSTIYVRLKSGLSANIYNGEIIVSSIGATSKTITLNGIVSVDTTDLSVYISHEWTFDDGTANDSKGTTNGTLVGTASIVNKALVTGIDGYVQFSGDNIAINTYSEVSVEVWFRSSPDLNTNYTVLGYLGGSSGNYGANYYLLTPARGDGYSSTRISCGNTTSPWQSEEFVNGAKYDDGAIHHFVSTFTKGFLSFYIDGILIGVKTLTNPLHKLANVSNQLAFLAKGGYASDPTWKGTIYKFRLYNKGLNATQVTSLFNEGAEDKPTPTIITSVNSLAFDTRYNNETISLSSDNLDSDIMVYAPLGVTVMPSVITKNTVNQSLRVTCSIFGINDTIRFISGSSMYKIAVKSIDDTICFHPLLENLIADAGLNNVNNFSDWGTRIIQKVTDYPENVYCGVSSIAVGNGISGGSGSLDVNMAGIMKPNTRYKIKAAIKTDSSFQLGIKGWDITQPDYNYLVSTSREWSNIEFTFITGAAIALDPTIFFNNWKLSGTIGYIDNWEMYEDSEIVVSTS